MEPSPRKKKKLMKEGFVFPEEIDKIKSESDSQSSDLSDLGDSQKPPTEPQAPGKPNGEDVKPSLIIAYSRTQSKFLHCLTSRRRPSPPPPATRAP